jgi:hypothetical protein
MINEVEEAVLEVLRKGLSEFVPSKNIVIGEFDKKEGKWISLINTGFTVDELGMGSSGGVKKEEVVEKFDADGKKKEFKLAQKPLHPLISVESPAKTVKKEPDDYTVNYAGGMIFFRIPPEKGEGNVQVKYQIARAAAEIHNFKFILNYALNIWADDQLERKRITLEAIKVLYRERAELSNRGVEEIKLIKGYSAASPQDSKKANVIEYQVETTIQVEMPMPPIEKIEIGKI